MTCRHGRVDAFAPGSTCVPESFRTSAAGGDRVPFPERHHGRANHRRELARGPHRRRDTRGRGEADRLAARLPRQPRARQPRVPHLGHRRRAPACARLRRSPDRRRPHRHRRPAEGRDARPGRRAACRHGCAACGRRGRRAIRVEGADDVERRRRRRDACVRPRLAHGHPVGRGRGVVGPARAVARLGEIHLPAGRGVAARRRAGRRQADDRGGCARKARAAGDLRPARHVTLAARRDRLSAGADHGQLRSTQDHGARPADARRDAVVRRRSDRHRGAGRARPADGGEPAGRPHARAGGGDDRRHQRRRARRTSFPIRASCAARSAASTKRCATTSTSA